MEHLNKHGRFVAYAKCDHLIRSKDVILGFGDTREQAIENANDNIQDGNHDLEIVTEPTNHAQDRIYNSTIEPKSKEC